MAFKPVKRSGLTEDIIQKILTLIREKQLLPGAKLPPEQELADMLQVSRPSLREAMRALAFINVVEIRQGDGTYVTSLKPDLLVEHLEFVFSVEDASSLQILEARQIVEPHIAALAAVTIEADELEMLKGTLLRAQSCMEDVPAFVEIDIEFHTLIVQAAGNPLLTRFMGSITYLDKMSRVTALARMSERDRLESLRVSYVDHEDILATLIAHDPQAAREAMIRHLGHVERSQKELIEHESSSHSASDDGKRSDHRGIKADK